MLRLWETGKWRGPSVMINAHPELNERSLPPDVPVVIAQGSRDEFSHFNWPRDELERIVNHAGKSAGQTGTRSKCFLYYTGDSGCVIDDRKPEEEHPEHEWRKGALFGATPETCCNKQETVRGLPRHFQTRRGDGHNMRSLHEFDCLPRLLDAAISGTPELHMASSRTQFVSQQRLEAEHALGYDLGAWARRFWQRGSEGLVEITEESNQEEYKAVLRILQSKPEHGSFYRSTDLDVFDRLDLDDICIERVQMRSVEAVADTVQVGIGETWNGCGFTSVKSPAEANQINRWVFHGLSTPDLFEEIAEGFNPHFCQRNIWGKGIYFARDASHAHLYACNHTLTEGDRAGQHVIILSLMVAGLPTLGNWGFMGLPKMYRRHKYGCLVDSVSNPEIFVAPDPKNVCPAYVITYSV